MKPERIVEIEYSSKFLRSLSKTPSHIQDRAEERDLIFRNDPFDPRLHTHKLHGRDSRHWSYSVDYDYRVKFAFLNDNAVLYLDIGTHDEVY